jgi:hypothetical protein
LELQNISDLFQMMDIHLMLNLGVHIDDGGIQDMLIDWIAEVF